MTGATKPLVAEILEFEKQEKAMLMASNGSSRLLGFHWNDQNQFFCGLMTLQNGEMSIEALKKKKIKLVVS